MGFAPVVEGGGLGAADLVALLALLAALLVHFGWRVTFGPLFEFIASLLSPLRSIGIPFTSFNLGVIPDAFLHLDHTVSHITASWVHSLEEVWHRMLLWTAYVFTAQADELANLTYDLLVKLRLLHGRVSPAAIQAVTRPLFKSMTATLPAVKVIVKPATRQAVDHYPQLAARVSKLEREVAHAHSTTIDVIRPAPIARPGSTTRVIPGAVARPIPGLGTIEGQLDSLGKRVKGLGKYLSVGAVVGLIGATIFSRFDLGWLRCRGVNRVGKALCGLSGLIEQLALDAIDVLVVTNLCTIATALTKGARLFAPEIGYLVSLTEGLIKCQGASRPAQLSIATYAPPPSADLVTL